MPISKKERREARKAALAPQVEAYEANEKLHNTLEGDDEGEQAAPEKKSPVRPRVDLGTVTVSRFYARKLNMSSHGGKQYETMDIGETRTTEVHSDDADDVAYQLYNDCKESVEENIRQFDNEMALFGESGSSEVVPAPKAKAEKVVSHDNAELKEIMPVLNKLVAAKTIPQLQEIGDEIQMMTELKKSQKDYLREHYNKKAQSIANKK